MGYKCLAPDGKVHISRNVFFNEYKFPFSSNSSSSISPKTISKPHTFISQPDPLLVHVPKACPSQYHKYTILIQFTIVQPLLKDLIDKEEAEKGVIRVKVKMKKEEANRLLPWCKVGGILEFKDVARELVNIPTNRVDVTNLPSNSCNVTVLKNIPEEF